MIETYIPETLIRELREAFPNRLPAYSDYYTPEPVTPERIAFSAGIQHCIDYLAQTAAVQRATREHEDIQIM